MDDKTRKTLELFVEKAERMKKYIQENHARNSIVVNPGGLMGVYRNADDEEWQIASTLDGLLVTFRMFVQSKDGIDLYLLERDSQGKRRRPKLLDLPGLSDVWYEKVEQAYKNIDTLLSIAPSNLFYNGEPIERWKILETFLYGDGVHVNPIHRETFNQWQHFPDLFGDLKHWFLTILGFIVGQILEVAEVSKHELGLNA